MTEDDWKTLVFIIFVCIVFLIVFTAAWMTIYEDAPPSQRQDMESISSFFGHLFD